MLKKFITLTVLSFGILFSGFQVTHAQDMNCTDFTNDPQGLMDFWHSNGYSATNDPHDLDRDNDGLPCEVSQADYDEYVADLQANEGELKQMKVKLKLVRECKGEEHFQKQQQIIQS
ncbi:excalibur calcium-binding domain-containing protein [Metabacillus litoralis]|uniref:excalibur calcium-binding domain-containing protein n=1 Tax=Metabacillus litoralis TaxID=152268 RepID=UPI0037C73B2D